MMQKIEEILSQLIMNNIYHSNFQQEVKYNNIFTERI